MATKTPSTIRKATKLQAQRHTKTTLRKKYGVLIGARLAFQTNSENEAKKFVEDKGAGCIVHFHGITAAEYRKFKREAQERPEHNPLAGELSDKNYAVLDAIHDAGDDLYHVTTPTGIEDESDGTLRTSTNQEASFATINIRGDVKFDLRGNPAEVAASSVAALREFARDILAKARRIELAARKGKLPPAVKHFYVRVHGQCAFGPMLDFSHCFYAAQRLCGAVIRVGEDGTEVIQQDYTKGAAAV